MAKADYLKEQYGLTDPAAAVENIKPEKNYNFKNERELAEAYIADPNDPILQEAIKQHPMAENIAMETIARNQYANGEISANDLLHSLGSNISPTEEKWLDNQISRENTLQQQNYEIGARDTSLLSTGSQLQELGLSPSNVISVGGAAAGVQGSTAATSHQSAASIYQKERINRFNQIMGIGKSLIGAASSMASSGIYGSALGAVKHSASAITGAAAHSGLAALKSFKHTNRSWDDMLKDLGY